MTTIYIYVDGSDLDRDEQVIALLLQGVATRHPLVQIVNQRHARGSKDSAEDLPQWDLGINFDIDQVEMSFLQRVAEEIRVLARETQREFVVGYMDRARKITEDIAWVAADSDIGQLVATLKAMK